MKDEQQVDQCLLEFKDDGLHTIATSLPKAARTSSHLYLSAFEQYDAIGNVGLNELSRFIKIIKRFKKIIDISIEGNIFVIKEASKKVEIPMIDEQYFDEQDDPEMEFIDSINMSASALNDIFKDASENSDATITITTEEKRAIFSNTGKYKFETIIDDGGLKGGAKSTFGSPIISALEELRGDIVIDVAVDYPVRVTEKTDDSSVMVIIAPRVEPKD